MQRDYRERLDYAAMMVAHGADAAEIAVECGLAWDDANEVVRRHQEYQSRSVINLAAERSKRKFANGTL